MIALKKCPICGTENQMVYFSKDLGYSGEQYFCKKCGYWSRCDDIEKRSEINAIHFIDKDFDYIQVLKEAYLKKEREQKC